MSPLKFTAREPRLVDSVARLVTDDSSRGVSPFAPAASDFPLPRAELAGRLAALHQRLTRGER